jgi:hypothetical protein
VNHANFIASRGKASGEQRRMPNLVWRTSFVAKLCTFVFVSGLLMSGFFLASCGNQTASGQHATVVMRDGSTLAGTVTAT